MAGTTDGPGSQARFAHPMDVKVDDQGNLYVADYFNHTIRKAIPITGMPLITTQPQDQEVIEGSTVTLNVTAYGESEMIYHWSKNGAPIDGASLSRLVLTNVTAADAGNYVVDVSNVAGTAVSQIARLAVTPKFTSANPLDNWESAYQFYYRDSLTYGNGHFVATTLNNVASRTTYFSVPVCGESIIGSTDAITWQRRYLSPSGGPFAVAFGNSVFVAVHNSTLEGACILTSSDAINWTKRFSSKTTTLVNVRFAGGLFFATTFGPTVFISRDGANWTPSSIGNGLNGVAFGNGIFIGGGIGAIPTSSDGLSWTQRLKADGRNVVFGNGCFLVLGAPGSAFRSTNGFDWMVLTNVPTSTSITFALGKFIALRERGVGGSPDCATSSDGLTWSQSSPTPARFSSMTSDGTRLFATSATSNYMSTDGNNWTPVGGDVKGVPLAVMERGGQVWLVTGLDNGCAIMRSSINHSPWLGGSNCSPGWIWVSSPDIFLAFDSPFINTAKDAENWVRSFSTGDFLTRGHGAAFGFGTYLATDYYFRDSNSRIMFSTDGINWGITRAPGRLLALACGESACVGVGRAGQFPIRQTGLTGRRQTPAQRLRLDRSCMAMDTSLQPLRTTLLAIRYCDPPTGASGRRRSPPPEVQSCRWRLATESF